MELVWLCRLVTYDDISIRLFHHDISQRGVGQMKSLTHIKKAQGQLREQNKTVEIPAFLGDLSGTVKADNNGGIYVLLFSGEVLVVRNDEVPPIPRLPVIVGYDKKDSILRVLRMREAFNNPPYVNLPAHADKTHQWPNIDTLWVRPEQSGMIVQFIGFVYYLNGWHLLNTQAIDFTSYIPVSGANYVLVQVDEDKVISFVTGSSVAGREMLEYEDIPEPDADNEPLFAVKMYFGQTRINKAKTDTDIIDLRWAGYSSAGGGGISDAPSDGTPYVRQDAGWVQVLSINGGDATSY
jgi:hypothetical protein